jgi:hypothetical protein
MRGFKKRGIKPTLLFLEWCGMGRRLYWPRNWFKGMRRNWSWTYADSLKIGFGATGVGSGKSRDSEKSMRKTKDKWGKGQGVEAFQSWVNDSLKAQQCASNT